MKIKTLLIALVAIVAATVTPAARAVVIAWASILSAPVWEATQPSPGDHRRSQRRGDRGELDVQASHPGFTKPTACLA